MGKFKSKLSSALRSEGLTSTAITALLLGVVIAVNVIVYALTVGYNLYFVPSSNDYDLSLSGTTDALFADALSEGKKVTVMFCRPEDEMPNAMTDATDEVGIFYLTAQNFRERYPELLDFEFVNIITRRNSKGETVLLEQYQLKDDEGNSYPMYESTVIFLCEDRHKTVADIASASFIYDASVSSEYYSSYCGEEVFASMVSWVLHKEHKKVQFTTFHSEVVDSSLGNMLTCAGYEIDTVNLRKEEIDEDTELIVISNPQTDFERAATGSTVRSEIEKLREFVEDGGNLYVALDPYVDKLASLESFLSEYGISYSETVVDGVLLRDIIKDNDNATEMNKITIVANIASTELGNLVSAKVGEYNSSGIILSECARLKLEGGAEPLLVTSSSAATYAGDKRTDASGNYCIGATAKHVDDDGNVGGSIFVMPTIYLTANDALYSSGYANRDFIYSVIEYLYGAEDLPYGCNILYFDTSTLQNMTTKMMRVYTVLVFVIPAVAAVLGTVVVIKRKNR